jgi:Ca2+-transporting ATPase
MSDEQLHADLDRVSVFTRVSPEAKLRLIAAYQTRGDIVAMIGDGVNDAAALKKADVGVTMGRRGTDVARETADVVLEDDRFETIGVAIEEGRAVFDNINKFVFYLFSCNLAEIIMILGTAAAGFPLPLNPIQILWLNLVTDTAPALALALEPAEPGLMTRPPRNPGAPIVGLASIRKVAAYGLLIAAPALVLNIWNEITGVAGGRAMTMNFMVLAFAQLFHLGNARSDRHVLAPTRAVANTAALAAVAIVFLAQLSTVVFGPLAQVLHVEPLDAREWMLVAVASLVPAVAGQAGKWFTRV